MKGKLTILQQSLPTCGHLIISSYRAILDLPLIPEDISEGGSGGTFRFGDLTGYMNSDMMVAREIEV
ncbi:MAG: hypothetical protein MZV63_35340 [Marinilabiliales bacterium]|nr:hypothetical protein [Marinilabiliales bacterium]